MNHITINGTNWNGDPISEDFTENEIAMLKEFWLESVNCCGACDDDENMSYMSGQDLMEVLGGTKESIGGTMASLDAKGAISDTGESPRGAKGNDWVINTWVCGYFNDLDAEAEAKAEAEGFDNGSQ